MKIFVRIMQRHPSAILLVVQLLGVLMYPFIDDTKFGDEGLIAFGIFVLGMTIRTVRLTPGLSSISVALAVPVIILLLLQTACDMPSLLPWSSGLESAFYFYAAGCLIAYMMEDYQTTTDEPYPAAATFALLVQAFTYLVSATRAVQPGAFSEDGIVRRWSELNHLGLALQSSTGMGGGVAVSSHARSVASLEMMAGPMYLAAVASRLISFTTHAGKQMSTLIPLPLPVHPLSIPVRFAAASRFIRFSSQAMS